jgi:uncharacterized membrane protein YjjB (DUF3815 family)
MDHLLFFLAAILGATCFAILFRTPRSYLPHTITVGFIACVAIKLIPDSGTPGGPTFIVALGVGCLAHLLARFTQKPAQGFLIPAIIFLVPGSYVYRSFSRAMDDDMMGSFKLFLAALSVSLAISFGLLLANWFIPPKRTL